MNPRHTRIDLRAIGRKAWRRALHGGRCCLETGGASSRVTASYPSASNICEESSPDAPSTHARGSGLGGGEVELVVVKLWLEEASVATEAASRTKKPRMNSSLPKCCQPGLRLVVWPGMTSPLPKCCQPRLIFNGDGRWQRRCRTMAAAAMVLGEGSDDFGGPYKCGLTSKI
jgi:hypothetical protein